jgi:hypothetical protein
MACVIVQHPDPDYKGMIRSSPKRSEKNDAT